jgi:hypothetical protein
VLFTALGRSAMIEVASFARSSIAFAIAALAAGSLRA